MTSERAHAYRLVVGILREPGPAKLTSAEQQRARDAADALIFSDGLAARVGPVARTLRFT